MSVFDIEDDQKMDDLGDKILDDFVKKFSIFKDHKKPGYDCIGQKIVPGDIVLVIAPNCMTKTRLVPAIVIRHTKTKTFVMSRYSDTRRVWGRNEDEKWTIIGEKEEHKSFYPEQIIKVSLEDILKMK